MGEIVDVLAQVFVLIRKCQKTASDGQNYHLVGALGDVSSALVKVCRAMAMRPEKEAGPLMIDLPMG